MSASQAKKQKSPSERQAELRFDVLVENLPSGILFEDEDRHIVYVNERLCELFSNPGCGEWVVGNHWDDARDWIETNVIDSAALIEKMERLPAERLRSRGHQFSLRDGREIEFDYQPIFEGEVFRGSMWRFMDITPMRRAQRGLEQRTILLETLHTISLRLIDQLNVADVLRTIVDGALRLMQTEHAYVNLREADGETMVLRVARGNFTHSLNKSLRRHEGVAGVIWATGKPLVLQNYEEWEGRLVRFPRGLIYATAGVPLWSNGEIVGTLGVGYAEPERRISDEEVELLVRLGEVGSLALNNALLYARAQDELRLRERYERELRRSEALNHTILDTIEDGYYEIDSSGRLKAVNHALARILGYSREEMVGTLFTRYLEARAGVLMQQALAEIEKQGKPVQSLEFAAYARSGAACIIDLSAAPVYEDGVLTGLRGIVRDVTIRKAIEAALRDSEETYRSLIAAIGGGVLLQDEQGRVTAYNQGFKQMLGFGEATILPVDPHEWIHRFTDESGSPLPVEKLPFEITRTTGAACPNTIVGVADEDGRAARWLLIHSQPIFQTEGESTVAAVVSSFSDITESKLAERAASKRAEQLATLQQIDLELAGVLDVEHVAGLALETAVRLSGASTGFLALAHGDVMHVVRAVGAYAALTGSVGERLLLSKRGIVGRVLRQGKAEYIADVAADPDYLPQVEGTRAQISLPLVTREQIIGVLNLETSDPERYTAESFEFLKLLAGRIVTALDNARLYSDKRQQLDELQRMHDQLSELEQLKTQMIRVASHDLRSPLGVLRAYLALLLEDMGADAEKFRLYFDPMSRALDRMQQMTTDVLSLERIHSAQAKEWEPVDLRALVEQVFADQRAASQAKGLDYTLEIVPDRATISGEPLQLYEAISNLIGNAIKYTPPGGSISIRLDQSKDRVRFEVRDSGMGVPDEHKPKLFQPFYRVKNSETQHIDGTGLGLYLVRQIIQRHGGTMIFNSQHGKGSTFGFELSALVK